MAAFDCGDLETAEVGGESCGALYLEIVWCLQSCTARLQQQFSESVRVQKLRGMALEASGKWEAFTPSLFCNWPVYSAGTKRLSSFMKQVWRCNQPMLPSGRGRQLYLEPWVTSQEPYLNLIPFSVCECC